MMIEVIGAIEDERVVEDIETTTIANAVTMVSSTLPLLVALVDPAYDN